MSLPTPRPHRLVAALLFLTVVLTGAATAATSTPTSPASSARTDVGVDVAVVGTSPRVVLASFAGRTVVLGPKATKRIVAALTAGGTGAAIIACGAVAPADLKAYCPIIVSVLASLGTRGDSGEKCLSITVGLGLPPVRVSLVPCPTREPAPLPNGAGVVVPVPGGPVVVGPVLVPGGPVLTT